MMNKIFTLILVTALSCVVCAAQEMEAAASSKLTGASLPAGARRVLPRYVPAEIDQTLEKLVAAGDGKLRRGDTEVVLWTGDDLQRAGAQTIFNRLTDTHKVAGWRHELGGAENGVTFFSLLKTGAAPRAIIGFYGEADGTLIVALTELHVSGGATSANPASDPTSENETGAAVGYGFTTPAGWSRSDAAGRIVLSRGDENKIEFLPPVDSSGNLEADAERLVWQVFRGCDPWHANDYTADWGKFERGRTAQGLEYFRVYRYAKRIGDENTGFSQSRFDAILLLVKIGGKVAVIAGRQPFQTDYSRDTTISAIDLILYDLAFENVNGVYDLKNDLLGSWSAAGGSVALAYTFNANGTFHQGAATEFRTSRDAYTDNVTTTSYGTTQSYSLAGNVLTQSYKRTGQVARSKIRIYETKYNKDAWQRKVGLLPLDRTDGGTIVLQRSN